VDPRQIARGVGVATTVLGGVLLAHPAAAGRVVGMTDTRVSRAIGIADLVLVPGLLAGRPRWPWMVARGALNLVIVRAVAPQLVGSPRPTLLRAVLSGLCVVTIADTMTALRLRDAERAS